MYRIVVSQSPLFIYLLYLCPKYFFFFRKKEFGTSVACFMANEYRYNLNVDLLLRNTLYKWTHNLSAVPELTQDATPLFQLKPPYNIAPFLTEFVLLSLLLLSTCRVSPSPVLTWHNTFGLQQSSYTVFHTHTLLFLSAAGVAQCGLEGLVFETRLARNLPHPSRPAPRLSLPPVQCVQWV